MQFAELMIAKELLTAIAGAGYLVTIDNGTSDDPIQFASNPKDIYEQMFQTDEDTLLLCKSKDENSYSGFVTLIYGNGNGGWDVISDYTTDLESIMQPILDKCSAMQECGLRLLWDEIPAFPANPMDANATEV